MKLDVQPLSIGFERRTSGIAIPALAARLLTFSLTAFALRCISEIDQAFRLDEPALSLPPPFAAFSHVVRSRGVIAMLRNPPTCCCD